MKMRIYYQWLEYPVGNAPVVREGVAEAVESGKSMTVGGVQKLKLNAWDLETGREIRRDYPDLDKPAGLDDALLLAAIQSLAATKGRGSLPGCLEKYLTDLDGEFGPDPGVPVV